MHREAGPKLVGITGWSGGAKEIGPQLVCPRIVITLEYAKNLPVGIFLLLVGAHCVIGIMHGSAV